jgi:glycosyltransferase involved in cell wall biosynthesis
MSISHLNAPVIWIAWEKQRRATGLALAASAELHQLESRLPRLLRYIWLSILTLRLLPRCRNRVVVVVNPCIFLGAEIVFLTRWIKPAQIIVDAHTPIKVYRGAEKAIYDQLTRFVYRHAAFVIVTNDDLAQLLRCIHPKAAFFVLPDKIPDFKAKTNDALAGPCILSICTFAEDEPYHEVFKAARMLADVTFIITGSIKKLLKTVRDTLPANVRLTDYLDDADYVSLLFSVEIIMDLTSVDHCMVCGAYEAVAAGKPLILSNKKVLRDYFNQGVVFTENHADSICRSIQTAFKDQERLREEIISLRAKRNDEWWKKWLNISLLLQRTSMNNQ